MADQIPFGVVEHILTKLGSEAFQEIGSMYGVPKEMTKLNGKLGTIKAVLLDAEEKQQQQSNHAVKYWVRRLKGVVYDADDLLDDYATHYLQRGGLARQVSDFFSSDNQVAFRLNMSHRLKDIKERIDDIAKEIPMLNLTPRDIVLHTRVENSGRDTHSFVLKSEMVGREENKEEIIGKLLSSKGEEKLSVVAIVGIGGLGKTTLAQLVYNDERVVNHFEFKIWACISDDSGDGFDVNMWIKKILKSLNDGGAESLETMKTKLHEKISQKRYLLVLDDVWNQNPQQWDHVRTLLMVGAIGSKIVVTTRKPRVASLMGDNFPINLKGLDENDSWRLFSKIAFKDGEKDVHTNITQIGKEIAKMCKGVPLIIKSLAMILRSKREPGQWLSIRNNKNLLSLGDENENVLGVLPNAITRLKNLQTLKLTSCRRLKGIPDNIGELINLRHLENSGCDDLTHMPHGIGKLTLLQSLPLFVVGNDIGLRNHKIGSLSELKGLNQLRGGLCISNLQNVRDVELVSRGEILKGKQYLQSLRLEWNQLWGQDGGYEGHKSVMEGLEPHQHLKDIFIEGYGGTEFPNWMMNDGLGSLFPDLIKIEISGCSRCKILPPFSQLPSLKSLKLDDMKEAVELKEGSLTPPLFPSLESLELSDMPKLKELWRMDLLAEEDPSFSHLSQLEISCCHNLASLELHSSPSLSQLEIIDCHNLASLELHSSPSLSRLTIDDCHNLASLELHSSPSLSRLKVHGCPNLTSLELHSSPSLSRLTIDDCHNLASLELHSSPSLSQLKIHDCPNLTSLELHSSPSLSRLTIDDCHNLASLELHSSPSLSQLKIHDCPNLTSMELRSSLCLSDLEISKCPNLASFKVAPLPSLETLYLFRVRYGAIWQIMSVSASSSLKSLHIGSIDDMISLPKELLQHVSGLVTLEIRECPNLASLELPSSPSLSGLTIRDCPNLTSMELPSSIAITWHPWNCILLLLFLN
ncbi:putative disease resistance protein RGA3 [Vitis vinifera]|uniref:Putative disease resistance protein RGA3 n=1 Tax=Vitis vinifera TaxID=29760 RepID=A0A438GI13_VITVI|nr:putative disease resistance protein RGA3 [Vitis vinifera]